MQTHTQIHTNKDKGTQQNTCTKTNKQIHTYTYTHIHMGTKIHINTKKQQEKGSQKEKERYTLTKMQKTRCTHILTHTIPNTQTQKHTYI